MQHQQLRLVIAVATLLACLLLAIAMTGGGHGLIAKTAGKKWHVEVIKAPHPVPRNTSVSKPPIHAHRL